MKEFQGAYTIDMELQRVVALNLARIRGEMPRKKLADKAGVSYQHVYEIEEGIKKPSLKVLEKLSKALGVELMELLAQKTEEKPPVKISSALIMMASVPDDVYRMASELGSDHKAWNDVRVVLESAIEKKAGEKAKKHQA